MYRYLIPFLFLLSCNADPHAKPTSASSSLQKNSRVPKSRDADTIVIRERAAIFCHPDSLQIEKAKREQGEDFYPVADDYVYYMARAQDFIDSMRLKVINISNQKFIRFCSKNGKDTVICRNDLAQMWGIYLFDPVKKPLFADITSMEEEYRNYFQ